MKNIKKIRLYKQNRFTKRAQTARRRSLKLGVKGFFNRQTIINLYVKQEGKCAICFLTFFGKFEVDHIIPLSRGGDNFPANLQLLCLKCNRSKGAKI